MKRIKLSLICTAALMLALPLATGCSQGDSGNASKHDVEQRIQTQLDENEVCPDGKCPEDEKGNTDKLPENRDNNGDKCPDGKCPNGKCPAKILPPHGRHGNGNGRTVPLPRPHRGN